MLKRLFALMVKLYPRRFRRVFEAELNAVFAAALHDARLRGHWAIVTLLLRELRELPTAVLRAYAEDEDVRMRMSRVYTVLRPLALLFFIPAVVATLCNFSLWNYWFTPPTLDRLTADFASVESIGYYTMQPDETKRGYSAVNSEPWWGWDNRALAPLDPDLVRLPLWAEAQAVASLTPLDAIPLSQVTTMISHAGWIQDDYKWQPLGYVLRGRDRNGSVLMLLSMKWCIRDDHYAYYEGLFHLTENGFTLLASNQYNYDVAGVEFAQWPFWFSSTGILLGTIILLVTGVTRAGRRLRRRLPV